VTYCDDRRQGSSACCRTLHRILKSLGVALSPESMILDFGCGSGRHTYEYVDAGFQNTCGYDIRSYVDLRSPRIVTVSDLIRCASKQVVIIRR